MQVLFFFNMAATKVETVGEEYLVASGATGLEIKNHAQLCVNTGWCTHGIKLEIKQRAQTYSASGRYSAWFCYLLPLAVPFCFVTLCTEAQ